jgi:hypothetical protein
MAKLIDVVNFNADASCLDSDRWLSALEGRERSEFCSWLQLFIRKNKPLALGLTGATIADLSAFNPESIRLIKESPEIFQVISRPFAHDLPFFRTEWGFRMNVSLGRAAALLAFDRVADIYLPPEFMQSNRQTALLSELGISMSLIKRDRFGEKANSIPSSLFEIDGLPEGSILCMPVTDNITRYYLEALQMFDMTNWNASCSLGEDQILWRDGESVFLVPDGVEREGCWLKRCNNDRGHIKIPDIDNTEPLQKQGYPVHPFSAWSNEMSMLWYIHRVEALERQLVDVTSPIQISSWLNCINSDILASIEKNSPKIKLSDIRDGRIKEFLIQRSSRGYEGEAMLVAAENNMRINGSKGWQRKATAREQYISQLL